MKQGRHYYYSNRRFGNLGSDEFLKYREYSPTSGTKIHQHFNNSPFFLIFTSKVTFFPPNTQLYHNTMAPPTFPSHHRRPIEPLRSTVRVHRSIRERARRVITPNIDEGASRPASRQPSHENQEDILMSATDYHFIKVPCCTLLAHEAIIIAEC